MKKILLATAIVFLISSLAPAQQPDHLSRLRQNMHYPYPQILNKNDAKAYTIKLDSITSEQFCLSWTYNAQGQIVEEVFRDKFDPATYNWREVASFDSAGNIIRIDMYYWDVDDWVNSAYLEFEYNALGQRTQRINVNNFDGTWTIGGKGFYTYTASGKLSQYLQQINMGSYYEDITRDDYYYAPDDKLEKVVYFYYQAVWDTSQKVIITYTGDLVESYSEYLYNAGVWENSAKFQWFYSGANNASHRDYFLASTPSTWSGVQDRYEYRYDTTASAAEILFPLTSSYFANDYQWFTMNHKRTEQDWWTTDVNTQVFSFVETQYYHYSSAANLGVNAPDAVAEMEVYPNPATEAFSVRLPSKYGTWNLVMTDMTGKTVKTSNVVAGQEMSVSDIPAGCYFIILSDKDGVAGRTKLIIE
ncbi:MAG TPA: T9SS type A sorting domain-containing protein [Bacteroidales bacterium]|nr:T9SS type A sorting domain-containing protein [Bacteroidales bacterium]